MELDKS